MSNLGKGKWVRFSLAEEEAINQFQEITGMNDFSSANRYLVNAGLEYERIKDEQARKMIEVQ